jgi:hypothetical protein
MYIRERKSNYMWVPPESETLQLLLLNISDSLISCSISYTMKHKLTTKQKGDERTMTHLDIILVSRA